ncbi:DUF4320 family protein [Lysinibacillus xylanilyticus]|uniref:DUF4320 family protein n=1 Tax=Lysinibacillus xylanilyticus TaxID=582475 RepID=UPI002E208EDB|nr:DUF4320 family protein [Lysinibacillus xylanilyticus]
MSNAPFPFFAVIVLAFIFLFLPEMAIYTVQAAKANDVAEQTTKHAELVGGITDEVKARFKETLKEKGLNPDLFTVSYSREGEVEHRGKFVVQVKGSFTFRAFNFLGTGRGLIKVPITATDSGMSEVWIR